MPALRVLESVGVGPTPADYERAVLEDNVLGKDTVGITTEDAALPARALRAAPDSLLFRALGDLWNDDPAGQPLLAGLCALARDPVFRASAPAIFESEPGDEVTSADLAAAVDESFPESYSDATLAKIGRNTFSSWEQTGHLEAVARTRKVRRRAVCTASTTAFALFLGHFEGVAGEPCSTRSGRGRSIIRERISIDLAVVASQRSLIDFRHSGGITEVKFTELLRPIEGHLAVSRIDDLIATTSGSPSCPGRRASRLPSGSGWPCTRLKMNGAFGCTFRSSRPQPTRLATSWALIDITNSFEEWMAAHEYRDAYFDNPKLIQPELAGFFESLVARRATSTLQDHRPNTIVGLRRRREPLRAGRPRQGVRPRSIESRISSPAACSSSSPAKSSRTTTACSTGATAGTTTPCSSLQTRG